MEKIIKSVILFVVFCFIGCVNTNTISTQSDDIVREQREIIDAQRRTIEDMGNAVNSALKSIESARSDLNEALDSVNDIRELFTVIDAFVRGIINAEHILERIQQSDS